ncbi:MAG: lipopolysaccharide transport periplasmic protein LptA [Burkholderiales bacterium]
MLKRAMNLLIKIFAASLGLVLLILTQTAQAEQADRTKPVNIEANSVDMDDLHKIGIYTGNVVLTQGTLLLHADKLIVHQNGEGFSTAVAYGNPVSFRQKQDGSDEYIEAYADRIDMDNQQNTVLLTGHAKLKKGADVMHADTMFYNTVTERFWAKNEAGTAGASGVNRVHTSIYPKKAPPATPASPDIAPPALQPSVVMPAPAK